MNEEIFKTSFPFWENNNTKQTKYVKNLREKIKFNPEAPLPEIYAIEKDGKQLIWRKEEKQC